MLGQIFNFSSKSIVAGIIRCIGKNTFVGKNIVLGKNLEPYYYFGYVAII